MKGAIFYATKHGSTAQYANWIGDATDLPVFDINDPNADPKLYDYLILGSSIILYRPIIRKWVKAHLSNIIAKPNILFTVSGAGEGPKLTGWVNKYMPKAFTSQMTHIGLRGKLDHTKLNWGMQLFMKIGALLNPDPKASKDERFGFDYMDKSSIKPIVKLVEQFKVNAVSA